MVSLDLRERSRRIFHTNQNFPNFPTENAVLFFKLYLSISIELNPNLFIPKGKPWYFFLIRVFFQTLTVQSTILFLSTTTTHSRTFRHLLFCKFACEMTTTHFQSNRLWPLERYLMRFTTFLNYCLTDWWDVQNSRFRCTGLSL